jgi:hypothetical protein
MSVLNHSPAGRGKTPKMNLRISNAMMKRTLAIIGATFCLGWIATEVAAQIDGRDFYLWRGIISGGVYAFSWMLFHPFVRKNQFVALLVGAAMPFVCCIVSIIGIGFLIIAIYYWYVFLTVGAISGLAVHWILVKLPANS